MILLYRGIQREPNPVGAIQCASFFAALEEMSGVYDLLFSVAPVRGQLKSDLNNNLNEVKERLAAAGWSAEGTTLREILQHDLQLIGVDGCRLHKNRSAIWGLLWVNRASTFIFTFLKGIVDGKTGKESAEVAYAELSVYHGFFTRKFVGMAMTVGSMSREELIRKMELPDEETAVRMAREFIELGEPLVRDITALQDELGTNFPDRM
jgi:hypothetical protein